MSCSVLFGNPDIWRDKGEITDPGSGVEEPTLLSFWFECMSKGRQRMSEFIYGFCFLSPAPLCYFTTFFLLFSVVCWACVFKLCCRDGSGTDHIQIASKLRGTFSETDCSWLPRHSLPLLGSFLLQACSTSLSVKLAV